MIIIFIELCRIADSLLWIPKSSRRTSSTFYIPNIIALLKMESQQLHQNPHNHHDVLELHSNKCQHSTFIICYVYNSEILSKHSIITCHLSIVVSTHRCGR